MKRDLEEAISVSGFVDQKPGTSGLRKKTVIFQQPHYVECFVQSTFDSLDGSGGLTLVVGGDGRFYNDVMVQKILGVAAGNGVKKVIVGQNGILSTPAVSALIRELKADGGFILTASHNPGGPSNDCGIKYNVSNGGPAPEYLTDRIYSNTLKIIKYFRVANSEVDLSKIGTVVKNGMEVQVIDSTAVYRDLMESIFDMKLISALIARADFRFVYDAMHGVAGPYAKSIFRELLGVPMECLLNCDPLDDFGGGHPDPNLTYAHELVEVMGLNSKGEALSGKESVPDFGAAADGDADRNMVLGKSFFVTPSDSLALIAANAHCIPYFRDAGGLKTIARSMPTSGAADIVAKKLNIPMYQVPTGWKFFGNLMDSSIMGKDEKNPLICGEESFGTGSSHIREKDGIWAVLAWLSILADRNKDPNLKLVSVQNIVEEHWKEYGRNYYCRYDYEEVQSDLANEVMQGLTKYIGEFTDPVLLAPGYTLSECDEFEYHDPIDESVSSHQGWRFIMSDGSRFVFRLSGTGSVGATIRLYIEKFEAKDIKMTTAAALETLVSLALDLSNLQNITGRNEPTVIT